MHRQPEIDFHRVARGIEYIAAHFREAPALEEVAAAAHVSPFHFQRMFTAWAGVSPKNFSRYLSLDHARAALRDGGASLLDAALDAGLSGPGRLHDLFVRVEGMTPGEYARGGAGLTIRYGFADSLFGRLLVASTSRGICHMAFMDAGDEGGDGLARLRLLFPAAQIDKGDAACHDDAVAALAGDWSGPEPIRLHLRGTPFQMKVWEALLRIPGGALASYGDVAAAIGRPSAARAVATAIAANPVAVLIPCHRVIRQSGHIGGYAWGMARKHALIGREAAARELAAAG
jgi:AraC family transcriptional regulator of adaptative response/methylated-DNA-[protein]-cysteine methyltransferase